jgi:hypothetical protein
MRPLGTNAGIVPGFSCPECRHALSDFAVTCPACGLDLITTDPRSSDTLSKSINRKEQSMFFYISPRKLVLMSIASFGIYELFWFYKNWTYVDEHSNRVVTPMVCAIFHPLTYMGLMGEMSKAGAEAGAKGNIPAPFLAFLYFALLICGRFPGPLSLLGACAAFTLVPAQLYVNALNTASPTPINDRFTVFNWVTIVIGGALQIFVLIGTVLPK